MNTFFGTSPWVQRMFPRYGDIVRVAPDEVSFATEEAWDDIYCHRASNGPYYGHSPFLKNPIWWGEVPGCAETIVDASTTRNHERMGKIIGNCFTNKALAEEEPSLHEKVAESGSRSAIINIVDCTYHPWVLEIFSYFKLGALFSTLQFYNTFAQLIIRVLPAKMVEAQEKNYHWACQKVHHRLNLEVQRRDFMSRLLPHFSPDADLENNFYVLTVAGSETCGTVLSGTTNYLIKTPALRKLTEEVRRAFPRPEMLTFDALSTLPYLNAVIKEGLRLSPPVGGALAHVVPKGSDTVCGVWLPGGTNVGVHQWSLYRSATKFHKATILVPERWLTPALGDPKSPYHADHRHAVQAFSTGSWACIGKELGLAELRLILARMVWNFNLEIPLKVQKEGFDVQLVPRADLHL
ncbi:cytochrome P450 [Lindgomyces ingoldianus]|uniref:Cytochrome P450 n=1 Tax=Lindgomyces ingoldianus TaxID=673940 RepID=A0ACB6Q7J0_9PLEO|nr:cytochrome P450 [Lindgomyces ingoldianus]KAF2462883.1 cytochrome P450 [Lindgomyces ingoldianus]